MTVERGKNRSLDGHLPLIYRELSILSDISMKIIQQNIAVSFHYPVHFTRDLFNPANPVFAGSFRRSGRALPRLLVVLDEGMARHHPDLFRKIRNYGEEWERRGEPLFELVDPPLLVPGGEQSKNDPEQLGRILDAIERNRMDRHSFVAAVGGGSLIDTVGFAAAIAHRGIRLIRIPTTVLAQNDASIGVKNGINAYGKKNFLGTFVPPHAVLNDSSFLTTLEERDWISGISEAVKVALIRDAGFFNRIEELREALGERIMEAMEELIYRCAELHLEHISGSGDPFESGSSRPLDFGHWAAHKLEQLSGYDLRHGEAVAIGIALDVTYSALAGLLPEESKRRILRLLASLGFRLHHPGMEGCGNRNGKAPLLEGLEEFREHLGGELTIMLLQAIGTGLEVNQVDEEIYLAACEELKQFNS